MIRYALICDKAHAFESWFASSESYEDLRRRELLSCPVCGSSKVAKQLMRPALGRSDKGKPIAAPEPAPAPAVPAPHSVGEAEAGQSMAVLTDRDREMRALLRAFRDHVAATAENVGSRFAEEARKIHLGETEQRSIYGAATSEEARALAEEGIEFHPLPVLPDDRN
jgi:hypothetical protein